MVRSPVVSAVAGAVVLVVVGVGAWWLLAPAPEQDEALEPAPSIATAERAEQETQPPPVVETEPSLETSEQEQAGAPAEQAAQTGGEQTAGVPAQEALSTQEQTAAPEQQPEQSEQPTAAPEDQTVAAEQQAATPEEAAGSEAEQAAAPEELAAASEEQAAASERPPAEEAGAPDEEGAEVAALTPPAQSLDCRPESEAPGCALAAQALQTVGASSAAPPELMLNQPDGVYLDQEYLVVEAEMPAELGGYLYLDVLTDAGQVFHLLPEPMREDNALAAGSDIRVGVEAAERADGVRHWQIAGPFSDGYLLATVSEEPLYEGVRPIEESISEYREVLLQSLADPGTGRKAARVERLEFRPRS